MNKLETANKEALSIAVSALDAFTWDSKSAYANWVKQTLDYSCHTVSLLSLMVARTDIRVDSDMHRSRIVHTNEEIGHDEWAKDDIAALGFSPGDFPELPETRMLWEPQFFKCDRLSVEAVYGYTIILEQLAVERGAQIAEQVSQLADGEQCNRFLSGHSIADVEHVAKDLQRISAFPECCHQDVSDNMYQTGIAYRNMLEAIK